MSEQLIYGIHPVELFLEKYPENITSVAIDKNLAANQKMTAIFTLLNDFSIPYQLVNKQVLDKKAFNNTHQGIIANVKKTEFLNEHSLLDLLDKKDNHLILILDEVTDPHNIGACIRSAYAAGVDVVIVPKNNTADLASGVISKSSAGTAAILPIASVTNLRRTILTLQDRYNTQVVGTALDATAQNIYQSDLTDKSLALIMGSEGTGIRRLTKESCDKLVYIPMINNMDSLNISVATGICLFQILRQKTV